MAAVHDKTMAHRWEHHDAEVIQLHPKQHEHRINAETRRDVRLAERAHEHHLTAIHNLRFVHVRAQDWEDRAPFKLNAKGGVTVAYQLPKRKGDRIIRVSVALVHDNDAYNKAQGRLRAAAKFEGGESIRLRVPRNMATAEFLKRTFGVML